MKQLDLLSILLRGKYHNSLSDKNVLLFVESSRGELRCGHCICQLLIYRHSLHTVRNGPTVITRRRRRFVDHGKLLPRWKSYYKPWWYSVRADSYFVPRKDKILYKCHFETLSPSRCTIPSGSFHGNFWFCACAGTGHLLYHLIVILDRNQTNYVY